MAAATRVAARTARRWMVMFLVSCRSYAALNEGGPWARSSCRCTTSGPDARQRSDIRQIVFMRESISISIWLERMPRTPVRRRQNTQGEHLRHQHRPEPAAARCHPCLPDAQLLVAGHPARTSSRARSRNSMCFGVYLGDDPGRLRARRHGQGELRVPGRRVRARGAPRAGAVQAARRRRSWRIPTCRACAASCWRRPTRTACTRSSASGRWRRRTG